MKVAVVTATRAEFGILRNLVGRIDESPDLELQLIVTGTHLLAEFGNTIEEIQSSGLKVSATVEEITYADTGKDVAQQVGAGIQGFTSALVELQSDLIVILGDRYEMLAASVSAFFLDIPIVHIHGGEVTEGAFDDSIRHAITKFSSIHCVAHKTYAQRVIQMGEQPDSVHVVGGLGADALTDVSLKSREELEQTLGIKLRKTSFLVTQHPVTSGARDTSDETNALVKALDHFPDATVVFTMPNADPEHKIVEDIIKEAVRERSNYWYFFESLGSENYWSLMAEASAIVGNSSSGILEAPSFSVPTVNIGNRQVGRIFPKSVVSCEPNVESIIKSLEHVLKPAFKQGLEELANPLAQPDTVGKIMRIIATISAQRPATKFFYDLPDTVKRNQHDS